MSKAMQKQFGKRLRQLRRERGLSQEELGVKANLHRTYIGTIERAEKNISIENVSKLAKALGVRVNDFFE
jgi:transcriptional regulator with XRE-family HTH domain